MVVSGACAITFALIVVHDYHNRRLQERLFTSVRSGDARAIGLLVKSGADPNAAEPIRSSIMAEIGRMFRRHLDHATVDPRTPLQVAVEIVAASQPTRGDQAVRCLLQCGANANGRGSDGTSFLAHSIELGMQDAPDHLLDYGADPNGTGRGGESALMFAADCGRVALVKRLLEAGARVSARNSAGQSAIDYSESRRILIHMHKMRKAHRPPGVESWEQLEHKYIAVSDLLHDALARSGRPHH